MVATLTWLTVAECLLHHGYISFSHNIVFYSFITTWVLTIENRLFLLLTEEPPTLPEHPISSTSPLFSVDRIKDVGFVCI